MGAKGDELSRVRERLRRCISLERASGEGEF